MAHRFALTQLSITPDGPLTGLEGEALTCSLSLANLTRVMWNGKLRYLGFGLLMLGLVGALLLTWLLFSLPIFVFAASTVVITLVLFAITWDGMRQTSLSNLAARGINPDDGNLRVMDPGLRRDFSPFLPPVLRRGPTVSGGRVRAVSPPRRSRLPAASPAAAPKAVRSGRAHRKGEILQSDATITLEGERQASGIDDLFAALDGQLIGLAPVKKRVAEVGSLLLVDRARQRFGLAAESRPNLHMCFTGPPGTGKTTVALMMADLLRRLGYLPKGHLVHAMRDDLVGEYIGQTAPRTRHVLERAMGGVLFIDEAYSLYRADDSRDYGQECVDILMQVMENDRDNLVVILAGYKDRMDRFFESNPGMRSRVAHHLDFAAYEPDELLAIGELILDRSSYYLSDEATVAFRDYLSPQMPDPHFANARSVRNALEEARLRHAYRLSAEPLRPWSKDDLMRIEASDIR
ncbi:MAG TPA: AAA family ATPase [Trebonia sp.]